MDKLSDIIVLIPHYNNIKGLLKSLDSIDEEIKLEILIVDDGSIVKPTANDFINFQRNIIVHLLILSKNVGIENALNEGLKYIIDKKRYKYIARLDAGDTCLKNRFTVQYNYLDNNPDISLVGAWAYCVNLNDEIIYTIKHATSHNIIKKRMFIQNMFVHPAVMFRVDALSFVGLYPTNFKNAEDYALFFKFVKKLKTANIGRPLINYEINPDGISLKNRKEQSWNRILIILENWEWSIWALFGLGYNFLLCIIPFGILQQVKKNLYRFVRMLKC